MKSLKQLYETDLNLWLEEAISTIQDKNCHTPRSLESGLAKTESQSVEAIKRVSRQGS